MVLFRVSRVSTWVALAILVLLCCSCTGGYQNERFTYTGPGGAQMSTLIIDGQQKLSIRWSGLYFAVTQQEIPPGSSLMALYQAYRTTTEGRMDSYRFISEQEVMFKGQEAMEYIYQGFSGEPYVQRRELWLEKDGWVYQLLCSDPVGVPPPGLDIPVDEGCYRLAEGFSFRE